MFKRLVVCSLTILIAAVLVVAQGWATPLMGTVPAVKSDTVTIAGAVTKVDSSMIEVTTDKKETVSVMVNATTAYRKWIMAKPWQQDPTAHAGNVKVGMRVRIDVAKDNPQTAKTVWIVVGRV